MAEWLVRKDGNGIWRKDDGTTVKIYESGVSVLEIFELQVCKLWESFYQKQVTPGRELHPWWDCQNMPPGQKEIEQTINKGTIQCERNDENPHLQERDWHVGRIACLAKCWTDNDPIRMKRPKGNMEIDDGAHRLMAARILKKETICAYEKPRPCERTATNRSS